MRKLLTSPGRMALDETENLTYQQALKHITEISLNLLAVKVTEHPSDFLGWCKKLHHICQHEINVELLDENQFKPLKKLQDTLETAISRGQFKMLRIAPWPFYLQFIQDNAERQSLAERLALLQFSARLQQTPLAEMSLEDRLVLAGKHTAQHDPLLYAFDIEWFSSLKMHKKFLALIMQHPEKIDQCLQYIPQTGEVTRQHYVEFIDAFSQSFNLLSEADDKSILQPASRLLTMRRPDQFIALSTNKMDVICQGMAIAKFRNNDLTWYWDELIVALRSCPFWHCPMPDVMTADDNSVDEHKIWSFRMALADVFFYADDEQASRSNYLRLRNNKSVNSNNLAGKRSKESIEQQIDKVFASTEVPEFIRGMRSTIVKSVQSGKSIEQSISLLKTIFA